jgi:hypothetical protein
LPAQEQQSFDDWELQSFVEPYTQYLRESSRKGHLRVL